MAANEEIARGPILLVICERVRLVTINPPHIDLKKKKKKERKKEMATVFLQFFALLIKAN